MSIWKSPVFYFGITLVVVVLLALVAPFVVPWGHYRGDLEAYGRKVTGREVRIEGPIAVRLFPWPRLEAGQISIASPPAMAREPLMTADKMTVQLSLAGLVNGTLDVQTVDIENLRINLLRDGTGQLNWMMVPDEAVAGNGLLSRVKLDQISLHNASVRLLDQVHGITTRVTQVEAIVSAAAIEGPWRLKGTGQYGEVPVDLSFSSSVFETGKPFRFAAKAMPQDTVLPSLSLDGDLAAGLFKGALRVDPQEADGQKSSVEGQFRPLMLQAQIEASLERASFDKIKIVPADSKDSGTLIEGYAVVDLKDAPHAQLQLKAPRVNLDTLLGATSLATLRDNGALALANSVFTGMPEQLTTEFSLDVNTLTSGGDTLNDVRLRGVVDRAAIRIHEASADMPGRSRAKFDGVLFPSQGTAELGGSLAFESNDLRSFTAWLEPLWRPSLEQYWTGSRGRLKAQTDVTWNGKRFGLQNMDYEFEGVPGKAEFSARLGDVPGIDLKINAKSFDLDNLLPQGFALASGGAMGEIARIAAPFVNGGATLEKHVALTTDRLTLNGVAAQSVVLDVLSSLSGFEVKAFNIGSVEGAKLTGSGLILNNEDGPSGDVSFSVTADDPRGFLQLIGVDARGGKASWFNSLGKTQADIGVAARPSADGPELQFTFNGASGPLSFDSRGVAQQLERPETAEITMSGKLRAPDGGDLAKLAGFTPVAVSTPKPGTLTYALDGTFKDGFDTRLTADALGASLRFDGHATPAVAYGAAKGRLEVRAGDAASLTAALGLPLPARNGAQGPFSLFAEVGVVDGVLQFSRMSGEAAGTAFSGDVSFDAKQRVSADIAVGALDVRDALALALLPWQGADADLSSSFPAQADSPLRGEIFIRPEKMTYGFAVDGTEAVVGLGLEDQSRSFTLHEPGEEGQQLDLTLAPKGASFSLSGKGRLTADLAKVLRLADGTGLASGRMIFQGEFAASGRSPAAVLAALEGKGSYWLADAKLERLSINGYGAQVLAASTSDQLTQALTTLEAPPGTAIGQRTGNFTITSGVAQLSPFGPASDDANVAVSPSFDMTEGVLNTGISVALRTAPELPPVTVTYSGAPGALQKRSGTSALAAKLGYQMLAKDMAALEALQQEQAKLAAKEEEQRVEDENRFAAYQAQRAELRERVRERKFFATERARRATQFQAQLAAALKTGDAINKAEMAQRMRRMKMLRQLRGLQPQP